MSTIDGAIDGDHHFIITGFPWVSLLVKITCEHLSNHEGARCCCMTTTVNCKQWSPSRTDISKTYLSTRPHAERDRRFCSVLNFIPSRTFSLSVSRVCARACVYSYLLLHARTCRPAKNLTSGDALQAATLASCRVQGATTRPPALPPSISILQHFLVSASSSLQTSP